MDSGSYLVTDRSYPGRKRGKSKKRRESMALEKRSIMSAGRPEIYSDEAADKILEQIATTSKSLKTICEDETLPSVRTIFRWLRDNDEFRQQYTRAKEEQADFLIEEMVDICDDGTNDFMTIVKGDQEYTVENKEWTSRSKLRVETRKWIASKLKPKKYSDKTSHEITGKDGAPLNTPPTFIIQTVAADAPIAESENDTE